MARPDTLARRLGLERDRVPDKGGSDRPRNFLLAKLLLEFIDPLQQTAHCTSKPLYSRINTHDRAQRCNVILAKCKLVITLYTVAKIEPKG